MTAISEKSYNDINCPSLLATEKKVYGPSHQALKTLGAFRGTITYKGRTTTQNIYVIGGLKTNLLGLLAINVLKLAIRIDSMSRNPQATKPIDPTKDVKLSSLDWETLGMNTKYISSQEQYPTPFTLPDMYHYLYDPRCRKN